MKIIRVEYTVKPEFVEENKSNINKVMDEVKAKNIKGFKYWSQLAEDGTSFMHISISEEGVESPLNQMQSFADFRMALKASCPINSPKSTEFSLVGAGFEMF